MEISNVPLPDHLKQPKPTEIPDTGKPAGWWCLVDLIGSRQGVLNKVISSDIPAHAKDYIKAEIDALPANFNHIELDAHYHTEKGKSNLHLTISPSEVL